jgi:hypothetical protein
MRESARALLPRTNRGALRDIVSPDAFLDEGTTLEVRWIAPGALSASMIEWFEPIPGAIESREDVYFVTSRAWGISLKIRGGARMDLKAAQERRGVLDVRERARGGVGSWRKWSFALPASVEVDTGSREWIAVQKVRRIRHFTFDGTTPVEQVDPGSDEDSCAVELTDVTMGDDRWWTLGFEARGAAATRRAIEAAAGLVLHDPLPDGAELGSAYAMSYIDWLRDRQSP